MTYLMNQPMQRAHMVELNHKVLSDDIRGQLDYVCTRPGVLHEDINGAVFSDCGCPFVRLATSKRRPGFLFRSWVPRITS